MSVQKCVHSFIPSKRKNAPKVPAKIAHVNWPCGRMRKPPSGRYRYSPFQQQTSEHSTEDCGGVYLQIYMNRQVSAVRLNQI